ncbi:MAG: VOC family protein [Myxococcota bacterium]|nr:VOC family protein [Myxococcota bacterium]
MPDAVAMGPISPFFIVADFARAVAFYRDRLGFELRFQTPEDAPFFGIVGRGDVQIHLKEVSPDVPPLPNVSRHEWAPFDAYVYVDDPEALARELGARVEVRDDGLRGFEVADADGYVLFFGRPSEEAR